jgi:ABC-type transport system involved in multi-copper enzyme maturation permease subunit
MQPTLTINFLRLFIPLRLAGPIFDKELRVASRQRTSYILRCAYVCLLMLVIVRFWFFVVQVGGAGSTVVVASRLGEAGKHIVATIIWFQFVSGQVLAAVLLSDAISGEIRRRTLDALLVTPISGLHIVVGKLASRLLQLVLLLAISLPLLAVVRVFGGVPWDYVISGLCITLTAAIFAGSLSLFSSVTHRHAYEAIVLVALWYLVVWGVLAGVLTSLSQVGYINKAVGTSVLFLTNPLVALTNRTQAMLSAPGSTAGSLFWPLHCLVILAAAAVVLGVSLWRVRRITLASMLARTDKSPAAGARHAKADRSLWKRRSAERPIRRVKGPPVVWKELCTPVFRPRGRYLFGGGLLVLIPCLVIVGMTLPQGLIGVPFFLLIQVLQLLLVIRLGISAAGAFTREKEARTWPILLTTPLEDEQIVKGKAMGAFRRDLPLLATLLLLYLLASLLGPLDESGFFLFAGLDLVGIVLFLLGVGLYLSVRLKTTAGAVASTLALYFAPKFFCCGSFGPLFLLSAGASGAAARRGLTGIFAMMMLPCLVYAGAGLICLHAATRRLRRDIF